MSSESPTGFGLLRYGLRGAGSPLRRIAGWSAIEAGPALLVGVATAHALDDGFLAGRPGVGLAWLALLGGLYLLRAAAEQAMFPHLASVVEPLRDRLVRRLVDATLSRAVASDRPLDAAAVPRLTSQVETVRSLVATLLRTARPLLVTFVAATAGLATLSPVAAAVVLPLLASAVGLYGLSLRALVRRRRRLVLAEEGVATQLGEVLAATRDISALGAQQAAGEAVHDVTREYVRANAAAARASALRSPIVLLGGYVPLLVLVALSPMLIDSGRLTTGGIVGATTYLVSQLVPALERLTGSVGAYWVQLQSVLTRLAEATAVEPSADRVDRVDRVDRAGRAGRPRPDGHDLTLDRVGFAYSEQAEPILRELTLRVPAGDHLVVVGASGIGKSTLANLVAGLTPPGSGSIRVGGTELWPYVAQDRAAIVALVPQEAYVFPGSVRENLCYLDPTRDPAPAVTLLGAEDLVRRLGGLDGRISDPATELSAGERQLLVLVRAYLSPAAVVVLDEASSNLDPVAEARAELAFAARWGTTVVIAHRVDSARRGRHVLLLDGSDAHHGTHDELLVRNSAYRELVGAWFPTGRP